MKKIIENKEKIFDVIKFILIGIGIAIFACQPYFNNIMFYTHDVGYHLNRITQISENLKLHVFPSLIHSGLLNNLGYANSLFYPELFLYIPAILMNLLHIHVVTAYKFLLVLITFFTFVTMYIAAKGIFKKKSIAWLSSLLYVFSLYRMTDIYVRGALGELLAMIFLPVIIYGLHEILFGENKRWWILSVGLIGLAYSHLLSFAITIPFLIIICLLNIVKIFKDKKIFKNLIISILVAVVISMGFFGPLFEQKASDKFFVDENTLDSSETLKERASSISMALSSNLRSGYAVNSSTEIGGLSEGIGAILIVLVALNFFRKNMNYKNDKFEIQMLCIGIFTFIMTTKLFPWQYMKYINIIQFPFRLNYIVTFIFALVGAKAFYEVVTNKKDSCILMCIIVMFCAADLLSNVMLNFNSVKYHTYEDLVTGIEHETGSSEYLPVGADVTDLYLYNINDKDNKIEFTQQGSRIEFNYEKSENDFEINLPLLYYKGYAASIEDENGNKTELEVVKNESNAHVLLKGDKELSGKVICEYEMTNIQKVCYVTATISSLIFLIYIIYKECVEKKKNK